MHKTRVFGLIVANFRSVTEIRALTSSASAAPTAAIAGGVLPASVAV